MAKQIINIGTSANKGNGDPLRTAFNKVNENFTELYASIGAGGDGGGANVTEGVTPPNDPVAGDLWYDTNGGRLYIYFDTSWVDASPVDGAGISSTNELVNGAHTVSLSSAGLAAFPAISNESLFIQASELGSANASIGISAKNSVIVTANILDTARQWTFGTSGTLTVPHIFPKTFTATVDDAHYDGTLVLTGDAWSFDVTFAIGADGAIETQISNSTPWPSNPGYTNGMEFAFIEADHGVTGYTFTLTLVDIQNPGPMMYTTNLTASFPPTLPATFISSETVKITADATSWLFTPNGNLKLPAGGDIVDSTGASVLGGGASTGNIGFVTDYIYDFNGITLENADLTHGATAAVIVPANGNTSNPIHLNNLYGPVRVTSGIANTTQSWDFNSDGELVLPQSGAAALITTVGGGSIQIQPKPGSIDTSTNGGDLLLYAGAADTDHNAAGGNVHILATDKNGGGQDIIDGIVDITTAGGTWTFDSNGDTIMPLNGNTLLNYGHLYFGDYGVGTNMFVDEGYNLQIYTNTGGQRSGNWVFGTNGNTTLPSGAGFGFGESGQLKVNDGTTLSLDIRDQSGRGFYTNSDGYTLRSNGTYNWKFGTNGNLTLPQTSNINVTGVTAANLAELETIYTDNEVMYQDALSAWMTDAAFKPVWYLLPGRLAFDEIPGWTLPDGVLPFPSSLPPLTNVCRTSYAEWQEAIANSKLSVKSDTASFEFDSTGKLTLPQGGTIAGGDAAVIQAAYDDWQADEANWQYLITEGGNDTNIRPWNFAGPSRAEKLAVLTSMWNAQQSADLLNWVPISASLYNQVRAWLNITVNQDGYDEWKKLTTSVNITTDSKTWILTNDGAITFPDSTTTTGKSITIPVADSLTVNLSVNTNPGTLTTTFKVNPGSIKLPTGNGYIYSNGDTDASLWSLDSANKTLFFPDAGDGVYPQIRYSTVGDDGMQLFTAAKPIKITTASNTHWTFGTNGALTLPAGGSILDSNGDSVLGGGGGSVVGITSSASTTYNVTTDWNWGDWNGVREIGGFTASAIFYSVLKGLQAGDTFIVNETDSYVIDHLSNIGAGATGYFNIFITTDSVNRFASVNSLTFDVVSIALAGNATIDSNLIINQNIRLKAGADIKDSTGSSVIGREPSFSIVTSSFPAVAGHRYGINTTGEAITAYLPTAPTVGDAIFFVDSHGTFATHNLTIDGSADFGGKNIMGQATQVVTTDNENVGIFYNGTEWRLYA